MEISFLILIFFKVKILIWKSNHCVIRLLRVYDENIVLFDIQDFPFFWTKSSHYLFSLKLNIIMHNSLNVNDVVKHLIFFNQWHKRFLLWKFQRTYIYLLVIYANIWKIQYQISKKWILFYMNHILYEFFLLYSKFAIL